MNQTTKCGNKLVNIGFEYDGDANLIFYLVIVWLYAIYCSNLLLPFLNLGYLPMFSSQMNLSFLVVFPSLYIACPYFGFLIFNASLPKDFFSIVGKYIWVFFFPWAMPFDISLFLYAPSWESTFWRGVIFSEGSP